MVFHGVRGYVDRMNRTRAKLALLAAVPLLAAFAALGTATAASARTAPGGTYTVNSGSTASTIRIGSNPSNYYIRDKVVCTTGTFYGTWRQGTGTTSTATCGSSGKIAAAYAEYSKTNGYLIKYWIPGDAKSGSW